MRSVITLMIVTAIVFGILDNTTDGRQGHNLVVAALIGVLLSAFVLANMGKK